MNNKEKVDSNKYYLLKSFYIIRNNFPTSKTIFLIMILFKYLGVVVNTRIIEMILCENNFSINKYLSNFFIFGKNYSSTHINYQLITLVGAIFLIILNIFIILNFAYMRARYKNVKTLYSEKFKKINTNIKYEEILFKIISYIIFIIIFFHQYIIEYYSFGIYGFIYYKMSIFSKIGKFPDIYIDSLHKDLYDYFQNNNHLLIFIINIIVVIYIFFYFFVFMLFHTTKGLFINNRISYSGNIVYLIMKIIILSFQPFFGISLFYKENAKKIFGIIINSFIIIICLISFWSCFHKFGYYPNLITNFSLFMEFFVFISAITEIILFFSGNKNDKTFLFVKLFLEIINTFFIMKLFLYFQNKYYLYLFSNNLFSNHFYGASKGEFYYYLMTYFDYEKDRINNYQKMFNFIIIHVINCNKIDCPEHIIIPKLINKNQKFISINNNYSEVKNKKKPEKYTNINNNICTPKNNEDKNEKIINNYLDIIIDEKNKFTDKHFQMIFEQEIIKTIDYCYQNKIFRKLEDYIFIHIQFLISIKKNYSLALYYVGKYNSCGIKWSFMTQYYMYEYKKLIISIFFDNKNINNAEQNKNKHLKDNQMMKKIIDYFIFSAVLRNLVINSCNKLKIIFNLREDLHSPIILKTYDRSRTKNFINSGKLLRKNFNQILFLLHKDMNQNNLKKISAELCYILSNFFIFFKGYIPFELKHLLNPNFDIISIANKLNSGYKFLNLVHPLILSLTQNNNFKISYFSSVICNRFGFLVQELKYKDFHEMLFPAPNFIKQHELLMKQFLFFDYNCYSSKNTFLKTKEGNLIGIKFIAKKYPTFFDDFLIIAGIDFIDEQINKNRFHRYSFILDDKFEFISQSKNFYEEFEFNVPLFKEIKLNFLKFFNINQKKFFDILRKKNNKFFEKNSQLNITNLRKEDDVFIVFKNINYENAFELRDISTLENMKKEPIYIHDKLYKSKILKGIPELIKLVEEYGLDFEWFQLLDNLSERLSIKEIKKENEHLTEYSKNIVSLGFNITSKKTTNKLSSVSDRSSFNFSNRSIFNFSNRSIFNLNNSHSNNNNITTLRHASSLSLRNIQEEEPQTNFTKVQNELLTLENYFDVIYTLKKIGSINYYLVDLYEKILDIKRINIDNKKNYNSSLSIKKNNGNISLRTNDEIIPKKKIKENLKNSYIKSKTHFGEVSSKNKNYFQSNNIPVKSILIENVSSNKKNNNFEIEQVKTLENDIKKNKLLKKYLSVKEYSNNLNLKENINNKILKIENKSSNHSVNNKNTKRKESIKLKKKLHSKINIKLDSFNNLNNKIKDIKNKNKDDDDEQLSFITKDILKEYINKNNSSNRFYITIYIILYIITFILITIKLYFSQTSFSLYSYLSKGLIILEEIKTDLYIGSLTVLSQCLRNTKKEMPSVLNGFETHMRSKSSDLTNHISLFEKHIKNINNKKLVSKILNNLYKNITIYNLDSDWSQKIDQSFLLKEINYFSYALNEQSCQNPNQVKCDFQNNFYILFFNSSEEIYKINGNNEPSFNQHFIYYIMKNILYTIKPIFYDIFEELISTQIKSMNSYYINIYIINSCLVFILILIEIFIILKNILDSKFIKKIFVFLYHYEKEEIQLEFEIHYLEIVAKEFNINNLIFLQNLKKYNYYYIYLIQSNNSNEDFSKENSNSNNETNIFKASQVNKNSKLYESNIYNNHEKIKNLDRKSITDSILNSSINNSSLIHFLNKNSNELSKLKKNKNIKIHSTINKNLNNSKTKKSIFNNENKEDINNILKQINEDDIIIKDSKESLDILKSNKNIIPYTIIISIISSFISLILFLLAILINIINAINKRNLWEYSIYLSMNYLERIPKIIELGLSTYIDAIIGNFTHTEFYSKEEYKKKQLKYFQYFSKLKNYDNSELIGDNIDDSYFSNLLYDCYKIKKNIEYSEKDNFIKNYFIETKLWNNKLNEQNNFCINSCLGTSLFSNNWIIELSEFFNLINKMTLTCLEENGIINENGLNLEIDFILHEISYLYLDYIKRIKTNITEARLNFFNNENFKKMIRDMNIPSENAIGTFYITISNDIEELRNSVSLLELIFIILIYAFDFLFLFFLIAFILFNEKDKSILIFISKIIKKN